MVTPQIIQLDSISALRKLGPAAVRRRLEKLVNEDILGVRGAQVIFKQAFGMDLVAEKVEKPSWPQRIIGALKGRGLWLRHNT